MAYTVTPADIYACRVELGDTELSLAILSDDEYSYFLNKNNGSIGKSCIDAAKTILFKLSMNANEEVVSILTIKGRYAAASYMEALKLYIQSPTLNPLFNAVTIWAGNESRAEIKKNDTNVDNNIPQLSKKVVKPYTRYYYDTFDPFRIRDYP